VLLDEIRPASCSPSCACSQVESAQAWGLSPTFLFCLIRHRAPARLALPDRYVPTSQKSHDGTLESSFSTRLIQSPLFTDQFLMKRGVLRAVDTLADQARLQANNCLYQKPATPRCLPSLSQTPRVARTANGLCRPPWSCSAVSRPTIINPTPFYAHHSASKMIPAQRAFPTPLYLIRMVSPTPSSAPGSKTCT
jgi:hypothetical protein